MRLSHVVVLVVAFIVVLGLCIWFFEELNEMYRELIDSLVNIDVSNPYEKPEQFITQAFNLLVLSFLVFMAGVMLALVIAAIIKR